MSKRDKLVDRLRARPSEMDFEAVCRVMEMHGWIMRPAGKHNVVFTKPGERRHVTISTVSGRMVKRGILIKVCEALGLDG